MQTKGLSVGPVNDPAEREANAIADRVRRAPSGSESSLHLRPSLGAQSAGSRTIQRACSECSSGGLCAECSEATAEGPLRLERRSTASLSQSAAPISPGLQSRIDGMRGRGRALGAPERGFFEPLFGQSLSTVRIHTGPAAAVSARELSARAFTTGNDIAFAAGEFNPSSREGRSLLAHELTHVMQQKQSAAAPIRRALGDRVHQGPGPAAPPSTQPTAAPGDFEIDRVPEPTLDSIYFARNSDVVNAAGIAILQQIKSSGAGAGLAVVGQSSLDEPSSLALRRARRVRALLIAAPNPITPTGVTATPSNDFDFAGARSVRLLAGAQRARPNCNDPNLVRVGPCATMDPETDTRLNAELVIAREAMRRALDVVSNPNAGVLPQGAGGGNSAHAFIERFFGASDPATLSTLVTNMSALKRHVDTLHQTAVCGNECHSICNSATAFQNGITSQGTQETTICIRIFKESTENLASILIHEAAHGTSPLGGAQHTGTTDLSYRHQRMIRHLSPEERLRTSDPYALFAMAVHEIRSTGNINAQAPGIVTAEEDRIEGFVNDGGAVDQQKVDALDLAIARLEYRLAQTHEVLRGIYIFAEAFRQNQITVWGEARGIAAEFADVFPFTHPSQGPPTLADQVLLAGVKDRYQHMKDQVNRDLRVVPAFPGLFFVSPAWWPPAGSPRTTPIQIRESFFQATGDHQAMLLLEALARATPAIETQFIPAYVSFARTPFPNRPRPRLS